MATMQLGDGANRDRLETWVLLVRNSSTAWGYCAKKGTKNSANPLTGSSAKLSQS